MNKKITVNVPATSANLGPGFDVLGVALHLYNEISLASDGEWSGSRCPVALSVEIEGAGVDVLPRDESNLVVRAAHRVFEAAKRWPRKLQVQLVNRIPLSRGLGSSAAATLGGMAAANRLCGEPLKDQKILELAVKMEGHADNIVPALVGGFCVAGIVQHEVRYLKFPVHSDLQGVVCVPHRPLPTLKARRVLPGRVPLDAAVFTSSRVAFLLGAFLQKRYDWLGFAMEDVLHQPARAHLVPGLREVIADARTAGAWGAALSGAGSSVIALCKPGPVMKKVARAMEKRFAARGVQSHCLELALENKGILYK